MNDDSRHIDDGHAAAETRAMERDRRDDPRDEGFSTGSVTGATTSIAASAADQSPVSVDGSPTARLAPRPESGLLFTEALDDAMREHRAVFAALAK